MSNYHNLSTETNVATDDIIEVMFHSLMRTDLKKIPWESQWYLLLVSYALAITSGTESRIYADFFFLTLNVKYVIVQIFKLFSLSGLRSHENTLIFLNMVISIM